MRRVRSERAWAGLALCLASVVGAAPAWAEAPAAGPSQGGGGLKGSEAGSVLEGYFTLLEQKKLLAPPASSVDELSRVVEQALEAELAGHDAEALQLLLDALSGPSFRMFEDFPEYRGAQLLLSRLLLEARALKSAEQAVDQVLKQGPSTETFGPAYRRAVDIALARGDLDASAAHLKALVTEPLPEDAQNELRYLTALAAYDRDDLKGASRELLAITQRSRFYASAQYMLGAIAARQKKFKEAEARFCRVAQTDRNDTYSFYIDGRFFPVKDLSQLALGRVAHETGRADDAFYYYFQVPNDSRHVSEALFEAAWASYEGEDLDAALDSLDQLETRFPRSPYAAEAGVLRGYVHLSRCEFAKAEQQFVKFERTFKEVLRHIDVSLESPAARSRIYRDLVSREQSLERTEQAAEQKNPTPDSLLLSLVAADPDFYARWAELRALDEELASTGHVPDELAALSVRIKGKDSPAPRLDDDEARDDSAQLASDLDAARLAIDAFSAELAQLGRAGAEPRELAELTQIKRALDKRVDALASRLRAVLSSEPAASLAPSAQELSQRFVEDQRYVEALQRRARKLRAALEERANAAGERALRALRERLAKELRRARIGHIDAVMGAKRRVELQVESLAAGRFPPELVDPLRMQSLLRDDEEYWPFEGEDWPDEFVERYPEEAP